MTDLSRALIDIRAIRKQVVSSTQFRGYGPAALLGTAFIAALVGAIQPFVVPEAGTHPQQYVVLWLSTAVLCSALIATQMLVRAARLHSSMADDMIRHAVAQFLPIGVVGAVLPFLLLRSAPSTVWLLPGLWQLLSGLSVFACRQCMPRSMVAVGAWFFLTGFTLIALGSGNALSPLSMSVPYAVGMAVTAFIQHTSARKGAVDEDPEF